MKPKAPRKTSGASMKDIAELAGVSLMTVSRALKGNPRHSKETRQKIQKIAEDLGYRPHPYVAALMSNVARTRPTRATANLAVLHFEDNHPPLHRFYTGILERSRELGFQAEPFYFGPGSLAPKRLHKILLARGIRGIILLPAAHGFSSIDFDFSGFAVSALGHTIVNPPLPRVASDIYAGCFEAFDEIFRRGYRRIGLINTEYVNNLARYLYSAALRSYAEHAPRGLSLALMTVPEPNESARSIRAMKKWILQEKIDVVVSPTFDFPLYEILCSAGFSIPGDLGYLHLINYPHPDVSFLDQMGEFMGAKAVDMVVAAINRNDFRMSEKPYTLSTLPEWTDRKTLPPKAVPVPEKN
jgi:LacI family transcriptional regulator